MDKSGSNPKRLSTTKRSSKSRKSKKSIYHHADSSLSSSGDATALNSLAWLDRMLNLLFLIMLVVSGAVCSIIIFNDVLRGHVDSVVASDSVNKPVDSAVSNSIRNMRNELPRYIYTPSQF